MRFKASLRNIQTFSKFTSTLGSLGRITWLCLDDQIIRFTVIPETGTQVWAQVGIDSIFDDYAIQSQAPQNTINLELPLPPLQSALRSAINATAASLRLTKQDGKPVLSLTIIRSTVGGGNPVENRNSSDPFGHETFREESLDVNGSRDREAIVTQNIPIRILAPDTVAGIHEPRVREPDVHVMLPSLIQLKAISDRFTKLAKATGERSSGGRLGNSAANVPKLELSANMHGSLKLRIEHDALNISSLWTGLNNPELDPAECEDGETGVAEAASTKFKEAGPDAWATVRVDGKDWSKVLSVGRMGGRVVACFVHEHALILYVYLPNEESGADQSVLTYYISSYTA